MENETTSDENMKMKSDEYDFNLSENYKRKQEKNLKICNENYKYTIVDTNKVIP